MDNVAWFTELSDDGFYDALLVAATLAVTGFKAIALARKFKGLGAIKSVVPFFIDVVSLTLLISAIR